MLVTSFMLICPTDNRLSQADRFKINQVEREFEVDHATSGNLPKPRIT